MMFTGFRLVISVSFCVVLVSSYQEPLQSSGGDGSDVHF